MARSDSNNSNLSRSDSNNSNNSNVVPVGSFFMPPAGEPPAPTEIKASRTSRKKSVISDYDNIVDDDEPSVGLQDSTFEGSLTVAKTLKAPKGAKGAKVAKKSKFLAKFGKVKGYSVKQCDKHGRPKNLVRYMMVYVIDDEKGTIEWSMDLGMVVERVALASKGNNNLKGKMS